jgi:hypothetical protein
MKPPSYTIETLSPSFDLVTWFDLTQPRFELWHYHLVADLRGKSSGAWAHFPTREEACAAAFADGFADRLAASVADDDDPADGSC